VVCNCKPSLFAYPPKLTTESQKEAVKMATAVLSTTAKKARKKEQAAKKAAEKPGARAKPTAERAAWAGGESLERGSLSHWHTHAHTHNARAQTEICGLGRG
jgi:26S proteasome regulatory subunit N2